MSFNKIANIGSLGAFILMVANIFTIISKINTINSKSILITLIYFIGTVLLFISLYGCFKYTENSKLGCKINLIGVFSMIPLLAFDVLTLLGYAFPVLSTLYTYTSLRNIVFILSYALVALFLISIYNHHTANGLISIIYKSVIITLITNIIILIPFTIIYIVIGDFTPLYSSFSSFGPSLITTATWFLFIVLTCLSYKGFLTELKSISEKTNDNNICETI